MVGGEIVRRASGPGKVALYPEALSYRAEVSVPQPYAKTGRNGCNIPSGPAPSSAISANPSRTCCLTGWECGMASGSIQRLLLAKPELTLQKAQNLAQALESADKNAKDLQGQRQPPMTAVNAVTCERGPPRGTRAHTDTVCHSCKKRGHLARVCRSKRTQGTAAGRYGDGGKQPQQTHALESETSSSASERGATSVYPIPRASFSRRSTDDDGVDTGAAVSVISEHTYHST